MDGKILNIVYIIDTGDIESILQCGHKFGVENDAVKRTMMGIISMVSH